MEKLIEKMIEHKEDLVMINSEGKVMFQFDKYGVEYVDAPKETGFFTAGGKKLNRHEARELINAGTMVLWVRETSIQLHNAI